MFLVFFSSEVSEDGFSAQDERTEARKGEEGIRVGAKAGGRKRQGWVRGGQEGKKMKRN